MPGFILLLIKYAEVFLVAIEVEPADWSAVVVVQQDAAIALRVAHGDSLYIDDRAHDGLEDMKAFQFVLCGHDLVFARFYLRLCGFRHARCCGADCRDGNAAHGRLEPFIDLVAEKLAGGFAGQFGKLLADFLGDRAFIHAAGDELDELILWRTELGGEHLLDLADVLEFTAGSDDRFNVQC